MKKILWLCNVRFSQSRLRQTGGWLQPLAEAIVNTGMFQIAVVAIGEERTAVVEGNCGEIHQWELPQRKTKYGQIASNKTCEEVAQIIDFWHPDLVHIWGTENIWASICHLGYIKCKSLIDIQGLLFDYTDFFYGQLTFTEIIKCIHLKEIIMPWRSLFCKHHVFYKRGLLERKYLNSFENISTQSQWVRDHLKFIFPNACFFNTKIMLRKSFYEAEGWSFKEDKKNPIIFTTCSAAVSYKGLHVAIKAISILKDKYPNIKLCIAGNVNVGNRLLDGYSVFLQKMIKRYNLQKNVKYLGSLSDLEIIEQLQICSVCIIPSFIETYCLALAESMIIGVPTVVSYTGGMSEQAVDNHEVLFYNSLDYVSAAAHIDRLIYDKNLAERLSAACRLRKFKDNNPDSVLQTQIKIYNDILAR